MKKTDKRNNKVEHILAEFFEQASNDEVIIDESLYSHLLTDLFQTTTWGFREILLVVIIGMKLDRNFRASTNFYSCKPRAIYETPIKKFLIEKNLPHRKSGPLNIAKATEGLNDTWAAQRQPKHVAEKVVQIINLLENNGAELIDKIGISLLRRLLAERKRVETLKIEINPTSDPEFLFDLSSRLINEAPDAGNTPQKIAALLLHTHHLHMHSEVIVTGGDDRASVTSTTSKKPGDLNEESSKTGHILKVYEITVKAFDLARIQDSYDCIALYNNKNETTINEIIVICRPEDYLDKTNSYKNGFYLGNYQYQDITYYYWNIYEWIHFILQSMTHDARIDYYSALDSYISEISTAETVKHLWKTLHESRS